MPSRKPDDRSNVLRLPIRSDGDGVTLSRETELLREIARTLAREAAREAFERALAQQNGQAGEEAE